MKNRYKISGAYLVVLLVMLAGCNKEGAGCFDKAGIEKTVTIETPDFTSVDIASNIDVLLIGQGADRVELTTGENLLAGISFKVEDGVLKIDNHNRCFWSNGYVHPLVQIRNSVLEKVIQHGYGRIFNKDTLTITNLSLQVEDASGSIDLLVNANSVNVVSNNIGPITLRGNANRLNAGHYWSDGILYAKELVVNECYVNHNGSNRMEINVTGKLEGKLTSLGNVYLFGQKPTVETIEITGEGAVIEQF